MTENDELLWTRLLMRIAEALERIVYLMETEPLPRVTIQKLHPSVTLENIRLDDLTDEEARKFDEAINEGD